MKKLIITFSALLLFTGCSNQYFVSFSFENGQGRIGIDIDKAITSIDDIKQIEEYISFKYDVKNPIVTNYIKLKLK